MKSKKIAIIDYGVGNLLSIRRAVETLGHEAIITNSKNKINNCEISILPGVGSFDEGVSNINKYSLDETIKEVVKKGNKILGICLVLQLFFLKSEESQIKGITGLNLIEGNVVSLEKKLCKSDAKIPHIGWSYFNKIEQKNKICKNIKLNHYMYYVHSFMVNPKNKKNIICDTKYFNISIPSIVKKDNIYGFQFHPEKSGKAGLLILKNFLNENN